MKRFFLGKIHKTAPPGIEQCLDTTYTDAYMMPGVCSYHGGLMIARKKRQETTLQETPPPAPIVQRKPTKKRNEAIVPEIVIPPAPVQSYDGWQAEAPPPVTRQTPPPVTKKLKEIITPEAAPPVIIAPLVEPFIKNVKQYPKRAAQKEKRQRIPPQLPEFNPIVTEPELTAPEPPKPVKTVFLNLPQLTWITSGNVGLVKLLKAALDEILNKIAAKGYNERSEEYVRIKNASYDLLNAYASSRLSADSEKRLENATFIDLYILLQEIAKTNAGQDGVNNTIQTILPPLTAYTAYTPSLEKRKEVITPEPEPETTPVTTPVTIKHNLVLKKQKFSDLEPNIQKYVLDNFYSIGKKLKQKGLDYAVSEYSGQIQIRRLGVPIIDADFDTGIIRVGLKEEKLLFAGDTFANFLEAIKNYAEAHKLLPGEPAVNELLRTLHDWGFKYNIYQVATLHESGRHRVNVFLPGNNFDPLISFYINYKSAAHPVEDTDYRPMTADTLLEIIQNIKERIKKEAPAPTGELIFSIIHKTGYGETADNFYLKRYELDNKDHSTLNVICYAGTRQTCKRQFVLYNFLSLAEQNLFSLNDYKDVKKTLDAVLRTYSNYIKIIVHNAPVWALLYGRNNIPATKIEFVGGNGAAGAGAHQENSVLNFGSAKFKTAVNSLISIDKKADRTPREWFIKVGSKEHMIPAYGAFLLKNVKRLFIVDSLAATMFSISMPESPDNLYFNPIDKTTILFEKLGTNNENKFFNVLPNAPNKVGDFQIIHLLEFLAPIAKLGADVLLILKDGKTIEFQAKRLYASLKLYDLIMTEKAIKGETTYNTNSATIKIYSDRPGGIKIFSFEEYASNSNGNYFGLMPVYRQEDAPEAYEYKIGALRRPLRKNVIYY